MLKIINLSKVYKPKKGRPVKALNNVSLEIGDKGMVFLLGKSGSGKSTLLNLIGGLDSYSGGDIIIKGKSTRKFSQSNFDSYRNTFIGFIFQEFNILEDYSVGKNIALSLELQHKKGDRDVVNKFLKQVDLEGYYDRKINELSGGQKQRVAIARALVKNPEIIMADEPTGSLDSKTGEQVFDTLKALSKEKLVVIVTHDRENAEKYGDRIIELADGQIIDDRIRSSEDASFVQTTEATNHIKNYDGRDFRLLKSKLPLSDCIKMGASGLKLKKIRLFFTIFLSFIAIALFGFSSTANSININQTEFQTLQQNNVKGVVLSSVAGFQSSFGTNFNEYESKGISAEQISEIEEITKMPSLDFANFDSGKPGSGYSYELRFSRNLKTDPGSDLPVYYTRAIDRFIEVPDVENKEDYMGIERIAGRLPTAGHEIALSDYLADIFLTYGYKDHNGVTSNIDSANELINRTIADNSITIVGVYKTDVDKNQQSIQAFKTKTDFFSRLLFNPRNNLMGMGIVHSTFGEYITSNSSFESPTLLRFSGESPKQVFVGGVTDDDFKAMFSLYTVDKLTRYYTSSTGFYFGKDKPIPTVLEDDQIVVDYDTFIRSLMGHPSEDYDQKAYFDSLTADEKTVYLHYSAEMSQNKNDYEKYEIVGFFSKSLVDPSAQDHRDLSWGVLVADSFYDEIYIDADKEPVYTGLQTPYSLGPASENNNNIFVDYVSEYHKASTYTERNSYYGENVHTIPGKSLTNLADDEIIIGKQFFTDSSGQYADNPTNEAIKQRFNQLVSSGQNTAVWGRGAWTNSGMTIQTVSEFKIVGVALNLYNDIFCNDAFYSSVEKMASAPKHKYFRLSGDAKTYKALEKYCSESLVFEGSFAEKIVPATLISEFMQGVVEQILGPIQTAFFYVSIAFSVFAGLMIMNFIGVSIANKKKDIGVLRAIGARSTDVFKIFLCEGIIIGIINMILATIVVVGACIYLNAIFTMAILVPGVIQILYMAALCFGIILIATLIPVRKIARKKPIDAINKR